MNDSLISKMVEYFSEEGLILHSKAYDLIKSHDIPLEDIEKYYELLCSEEIIPDKINKRNHKMCCLYYLSGDNEKYLVDFSDNYINDKLGKEKNYENLIMIFNIIEFDKTYLDSSLKDLKDLYNKLKAVSGFETDKVFYYILFKYYRGYMKFRIGDLETAKKENKEIKNEMNKNKDNEDFFMKYIKILNDLLEVKIYNTTEKKSKDDFDNYIHLIKSLYDEVKIYNRTLSLKLGYELFSAYIEGKEFNKNIPLLKEMKNILNNCLFNENDKKYKIDYFLAFASRMGYMGIILNDKTLIEEAIKEIKEALEMPINNNKDKRTIELIKAYRFLLAILEMWLTQEIKYDMKSIASEFKEIFLPDLKSNAYNKYIINEKNKESIIMNLKIVDNTNPEIYKYYENIKEKYSKDLNNQINLNNINFISLLSFYHEEICLNSEKLIKSKNPYEKKEAIEQIIKYFEQTSLLIHKFIEEPFIQIPFVKLLIIDIYSSYAYILFRLEDFAQLKEIINDITDNTKNNLRDKLNIDEKIPSYGLWLKIKGDYYFKLKQYEEAIESYKNAMQLLNKNHPLKNAMTIFNCGCAYYFTKNKTMASFYFNKSIVEFDNIKSNNNCFCIGDDIEIITSKINIARKLEEALSKEKNEH